MTTQNEDYKVGFCKPPKHAQFKKGQSGNPSGRKKAAENKYNDPNPVRAILLEMITTTNKAGRKKMMTKIEALTHQYVSMAMKGDHKAAQLLFRSCGGLDTLLFWGEKKDGKPNLPS